MSDDFPAMAITCFSYFYLQKPFHPPRNPPQKDTKKGSTYVQRGGIGRGHKVEGQPSTVYCILYTTVYFILDYILYTESCILYAGMLYLTVDCDIDIDNDK